MSGALLRRLAVPALLLGLSAPVSAQTAPADSAKAVAEVRQAIRDYDAALRRSDTAAVGRIWAPEYVFVNGRGEHLTRVDRMRNLVSGRTSLDTLVHAPQEDRIRVYGDVATYTTLLTLGGRYSGRPERGQFRALLVLVRRDGRWQHVANQLTPVVAP